jgi:dihydrodipicolinate synthase/N-acetylneuraminate lyase
VLSAFYWGCNLNEIKQKLKGIIAVVNTPFTIDDHIDESGLRRYVQNALKDNVTGFLVNGMAAEVDKLTLQERSVIAETVISEVNERVPVIGGAYAIDHISRKKVVQDLDQLGCDGIMINIPYRNDASYIQQVSELSEYISGFIMLQDWSFDGSGIPINTILRLYDKLDNFKSIKIEVKAAGIKYTQVIEQTKAELHVCGGWAASQMIEALDRGVDTFMPTLFHSIYDRIFKLHEHGKRVEANKLFQEILPVLAFSHQHVDISIHFAKRFMHEKEIFNNDLVRQPILKFDSYHTNVANEMIEKALILEQNLQKYSL